MYTDENSEESHNILFRIESFFIDLEIMSFSLNNSKEASLQVNPYYFHPFCERCGCPKHNSFADLLYFSCFGIFFIRLQDNTPSSSCCGRLFSEDFLCVLKIMSFTILVLAKDPDLVLGTILFKFFRKTIVCP
jgi:hypothetical protein